MSLVAASGVVRLEPRAFGMMCRYGHPRDAKNLRDVPNSLFSVDRWRLVDNDGALVLSAIMGRQGRWVATLLLVAVLGGEMAGCGSEESAQERSDRIKVEAQQRVDEWIDVRNSGTTAGELLRDTALARGGMSPVEAVPGEAECRAEWERQDLDEKYGQDLVASWVAGCTDVDVAVPTTSG